MKAAITALVAFFAMTVAPLSPHAATDATAESIDSAITAPLEHPYLYFTQQDKDALLDRIASDPECADIYARQLAECRRLLYTPVEATPPPKDPRAGFHGNDRLLAYLRANVSSAQKLAFVYQMTGDTCYADKAFEFADVVCDMPLWVDVRHRFPVIYNRVWPYNVDDDQAAFAVDLETTDTARVLASVYDWLYPALDKRCRDRIRGALLEKAILPVRGNYEYHWWASSYRCNWCSCCNAGIGTVALALLTEDPNLVDVVAESVNRINRQFDEIGIDGGWQEGCGYYRKSIHAVNYFADPLKRLTRGRVNIYSHPRIQANPISFLLYNTITPRRLIPFEDSAYGRAGTSHIWNKLAEETKSPETAWFRDYMWGQGSNIFDIVWPRASVIPALPKATSRHFRTLGWAIMRSSFTDPERVLVACKAGMNNDPHHGHLDCGHFIVYWRNQEYVADLGSPPYDEFYFDDVRFDYPQVSSVGHNVVLVDGELQIPAKRKDTPWREGVGGHILEFTAGTDRDSVLMDLSGAYPGEKLNGWRRHIILDKPTTVVILDEVQSAPGAEIETRFHSHASMKNRGRFLYLEGDEGAMALIPVVTGEFAIREGFHASLPVLERERYERISYAGTVVKSMGESTMIGTVILPVANPEEADRIAQSARLTVNGSGEAIVSFEAKDGTKTFRFSPDSRDNPKP